MSKEFVCESCDNSYTRQDSLNRHINNSSCAAPDNWSGCATCGGEYKSLGKHYQYNQSHRPSLTDSDIEIITGVLMGDGHIGNRDMTPRLSATSVTEEYIRYLYQELSLPGKILRVPPGENNVQVIYVLSSIVHPDLQELATWYSSGTKVFPDDVNMSPKILRHWYVTDGSLQQDRYPTIRATNESENGEKIMSYFDDTPLNVSFSSGTLRFPNSKNEFFEFIGEPLPGFRYKWPNYQ